MKLGDNMNATKNSKIRLLILGYSYLARKCIIESIKRNPYFILDGIASKNNYEEIPKEFRRA